MCLTTILTYRYNYSGKNTMQSLTKPSQLAKQSSRIQRCCLCIRDWKRDVVFYFDLPQPPPVSYKNGNCINYFSPIQPHEIINGSQNFKGQKFRLESRFFPPTLNKLLEDTDLRTLNKCILFYFIFIFIFLIYFFKLSLATGFS